MSAPQGRALTLAARLLRCLTRVAVSAAVFGAVGAHAADAVPDPAAAAASAPATAVAPAVVPAAVDPAPTLASVPQHSPESLQITDPFVELRTGPGRGFPIFFVAPRGEWVVIELRHTDWYRVRTEGGRVGWVDRKQLETTLTSAGGKKTFRDVLIDDYLNRHVQLGAAWGHFKSEPMLKVWGSYRLSETLGIEGTIGQVQGVFSGTNFWHVNLTAEPWSDRRFSPFFGVGVGRLTNFPNLSLIGAETTNAKLANASVGVRYYLTDRFILRADYTIYTAFLSDSKSTEYRAWTGGLSFFF
jgi:hypothetical protein